MIDIVIESVRLGRIMSRNRINGGAALITAPTIEFDIEKRDIRHDGEPVTIRVLRVSSYDQE